MSILIFLVFSLSFVSCIDPISISPMDLLVILEDSDYVAPDDSNFQKELIQKLYKLLDPMGTTSRISLMYFSDDARTPIRFGDTSSKNPLSMIDVVRTVSHVGGKTCIDKALQKAKTELFEGQVNIHEATKVVLFISHSPENCTDITNTVDDAQYLLSSNVLIFTIGVGRKIDSDQLKAIAGYDDRCDFYPDYPYLEMNLEPVVIKISKTVSRFVLGGSDKGMPQLPTQRIEPSEPLAVKPLVSGMSSEPQAPIKMSFSNGMNQIAIPTDLEYVIKNQANSDSQGGMNSLDQTGGQGISSLGFKAYDTIPNLPILGSQNPYPDLKTESSGLPSCIGKLIEESGCITADDAAECFPVKFNMKSLKETDDDNDGVPKTFCDCASQALTSGYPQFVQSQNGDCLVSRDVKALKRRSFYRYQSVECSKKISVTCQKNSSLPVYNVSFAKPSIV